MPLRCFRVVHPSFSLELLIISNSRQNDRSVHNSVVPHFTVILLHGSTSTEAMWPCSCDSTSFDSVLHVIQYKVVIPFTLDSLNHPKWPGSGALLYWGGRSPLTSINRSSPAVVRAAHFLPPPVSVGYKYDLLSFAIYSTQVRSHHAGSCFTVLRSPPFRGPARPLQIQPGEFRCVCAVILTNRLQGYVQEDRRVYLLCVPSVLPR